MVGFFGLSVREYPDVDPPIVSVETRYIGAAASVVETRVTQVLEEQLAGLEGLQTITSRSRDGQSDISIEFTAGRDIDSAANDVRDRVGAAAGNLPTEVEPPVVRKVDADAAPIMFLVISKPGWSRLQLSDWVDRNLLDRFSSIDGVARVFIGGEARPAMRVWIRPERLAAFGLTPADVENALRTQNVELPAGRLESAQQNVTLRVDRPFATPEQFRAAGRRPRQRRLSGPPRRRRADRAGPGKSLCDLPPQRQSGGRPRHRPPVGRQHARRRRGRQGDGRAGSSRTCPKGMDHRRRLGRDPCSSTAPSRRSG